MPRATPDPEPVLYVVVESFFAVDDAGTPTVYAKGEVVHPDDPHLKLTPARFRPFAFPHPVKSRRALATPEVRAD